MNPQQPRSGFKRRRGNSRRGGKQGRGLRSQSIYFSYTNSLDAKRLKSVGCSGPTTDSSDLETLLEKIWREGGRSKHKRALQSLRSDVHSKVMTLMNGRKEFLSGVKERETTKQARGLKRTVGSGRWRAKVGLDDFERVPYEVLHKVHVAWREYAKNVLMLYRKVEEGVLELDFHGAMLEIVASNSPKCVRFKGIVVRDLGSEFELASKEGRLMKVGKVGTTFRLEVLDKEVIMNGTRLASIQGGKRGND